MRLTLNVQILLGALLGILAGVILGHSSLTSTITSPFLFSFDLIGHFFINLLKMILIPLVFTSIVAGITNLQGSTHIRRIWPTLLVYSLSTSALAAATGLLAVNVFKPGANLNIQLFHESISHFQAQSMTLPEFARSFLNGLFTNPIAAMAQNNILGTVGFAAFVGVALITLGPRVSSVIKIIHEAFEVTMTIIGWIMRLAPLGIMGLLATLVAGQSWSLLTTLSQYIALVLGTTLFHGLITLPLILWLIASISPLRFFNAMKEAFITAFSTSSSTATLPVSLRCVSENLKIDRHVAGFVLPVGATLNMDGTALYEAMAALFVANLCGVHLTFLHQVVVVLTAMIASIGAPGIPSAGMVTLIMVLQSVGLPAEAVAILIPIDRPLDTLRTVVNVEGDAVAACVVQKIISKA
jgi:Na+/H+-dicarboxylate symporter